MAAGVFLDTNILLYSEDFTHGQEFDGLHVVNPFL